MRMCYGMFERVERSIGRLTGWGNRIPTPSNTEGVGHPAIHGTYREALLGNEADFDASYVVLGTTSADVRIVAV